MKHYRVFWLLNNFENRKSQLTSVSNLPQSRKAAKPQSHKAFILKSVGNNKAKKLDF